MTNVAGSDVTASNVTGNDVTIRIAIPADARRIAELLHAGSMTGGDPDPSDLRPYEEAIADLSTAPGAVLVAEVGGVAVGVCQLIIFRHLQHRGGRCAELESVFIDERYRGRRVGGALVDYAVALAQEAGCYRVQLTSNNARSDAHRFWTRNGFGATHQGFKKLLS